MSLFNKKPNVPKTPVVQEQPIENIEDTEVNDNKPLIVEDTASNGQDEVPLTTSKVEDIVAKYTNVDFNLFSKRKMFSVIAELIMEVKRLRFLISKQDTENDDFFQSFKKSKKETKDIEDKIDYLGRKLSQNYINAANSPNAKKLTVDQKISMIIQEVLNERKEMTEEFLEYEKKITNNKRVLDELKAQILDQTIQNNEALADEEQKSYSEKDFETFAGTHEGAISAGGDLAIRVFDIQKTKSQLGEVETKIIELVGGKGLSEYGELLQECTKFGITESKFDTAFSKMSKEYQILDVEQPQTMTRKRGVRVCSLSNDIGKNLYLDFFKAKPVLSEKEKLVRENDNLVHGYSIKETAQILEGRGYTEISFDRKKNTIDISGNSKWIPDIIAINPVTGKMEYFEVEMGTHTNEDFENKLDKANFRAKTLKFVVASSFVQQKLISKVENWLAKRDRKKISMSIFIMTIKDLRDKTDGKVLNSKEPLISIDEKIPDQIVTES